MADTDVADTRTRAALIAHVLICLAALVAVALLKGQWLDEYWSLWLTDPALPAGRLLEERWLPDPHPIFFNALLHFERVAIPASIELNRLVTNAVPILLLVAATAFFCRIDRRGRPFSIMLLVMMLALPYTYREFGDLRSYTWQLSATAVWVQFVYHALTRAPGERPRTAALVVAAIAVLPMIGVHYVAGLQASVLYAVPVAELLRRRRRFALWTAPAAVAAWGMLLASVAIQSGYWAQHMDVKWIETGTLGAFKLVTLVGVAVVLSSPVVIWAMLATLRRTPPPERGFQIVMSVAVLAAIAVVVLLNVVRPIAVDRYFSPLYPAIAGIAAAGAVAWWRTRPGFRLLMIGAATVAALLSAVVQSQDAGWRNGARVVARLVRQCPASRAYAISSWAFKPGAASATAVREAEIFRLGYAMEAARAGFRFTLLPPVPTPMSVPVAAGPCPTILWVEHHWPPIPADRAFAMSGLALPPGTPARLVPGAPMVAVTGDR